VCFYISGHGFGHSIRQIEIINALRRIAPDDLGIVVRTNAPAWLFDRTVRGAVTLQALETDTGVVQLDALRLDERETVERAIAFHDTLAVSSAREADALAGAGARLVVSDAPPLACAAARRAGIPAVVCANFTWDWIYAAYGDAAPGVPKLIADLREAYSSSDAWRLPLHGGFGSFARVVDIPFVARHARPDCTRDDVRRSLHLPVDRPLALVSFGGYGVHDLPLGQLDCTAGWDVVLTAPGLRTGLVRPGVQGVSEGLIYDRGLRYEDLVHAVDVVVTKPGYGIISDCIANGAAMLYTSRGNFPEYGVLVREMPRFLRCQFLEMDAFLEGRWREGLDAVAAKPPAPEQPRTDGADVVARMILESLVPSPQSPVPSPLPSPQSLIPDPLFDRRDERPDLREVHLLDRDGPQVRLGKEGGQIQIRLEADVNRHGRDQTFEPRQHEIGAEKVVQEDDASTGTADAAHLLRDPDRIGHHADEVRSVHDVERPVREFQISRVHLDQPDGTGHVLSHRPLARLLEHGRREIDAGDGTILGVQREVDARADPDLEHALVSLDVHALNGAQAARMQCRTEDVVVDLRELVVDAFDEVVLDRGHGERTCRGIRTGD
jgi:L-arabinokinase